MKKRVFALPAALLGAMLLSSANMAPPGMIKIPGGTFAYGTDTSEIAPLVARFEPHERDLIASEAPKYKVTLPTFWMDETEVTVNDFVVFVMHDTLWLPKKDSGKVWSNGAYLRPWLGGSVPQATDSLPVTYVTWFAARAFCKAAKKRLPTEVEWEYAARGGVAGEVFPWGDTPPDTGRANYFASGIGHTVRVHRYAPNPYGLFDMAGNVWEYTADQWTDPREPPTNKPVQAEEWSKDPEQATKQRVVIRGGSYDAAVINMRVRYRDSHPAGGAQEYVGFRCAKNF